MAGVNWTTVVTVAMTGGFTLGGVGITTYTSRKRDREQTKLEGLRRWDGEIRASCLRFASACRKLYAIAEERQGEGNDLTFEPIDFESLWLAQDEVYLASPSDITEAADELALATFHVAMAILSNESSDDGNAELEAARAKAMQGFLNTVRGHYGLNPVPPFREIDTKGY